MPKRWLVKRRLPVVLEAMYTWIYGQQQFGKCWYIARSQPTSDVVKLYLRKIFSYVFCVRKYFYNENKVNYSIVINQAQMLYFVCCFEIVCTVHCERDVTYYSFVVTIN